MRCRNAEIRRGAVNAHKPSRLLSFACPSLTEAASRANAVTAKLTNGVSPCAMAECERIIGVPAYCEAKNPHSDALARLGDRVLDSDVAR